MADAYIAPSNFDVDGVVNAVRDLIVEPAKDDVAARPNEDEHQGGRVNTAHATPPLL